jgi:uncharacterized membrane protein YhaH (DUF805 family)
MALVFPTEDGEPEPVFVYPILGRAMDLQWLLFSFGGRINRAKYWLVILINLIVPNVAGVIAAMVLGMSAIDFESGELPSAANPGLWIAGLIGLAIVVFSIWTGLAAGIKRLHDRNKSGWWILVFGALPVAFGAASGLMGDAGYIGLLAALGVWLWAFIELGCLKGTTGPNVYGPDPLPAVATA